MNIPATAETIITVQGQRRPGHATLLSYATSPDGIAWQKPTLNLVDFEGSTANNMVAPDMYNPEGFSVLHEPDDPDPARRYKAFYWDHGFGPLVEHEGVMIYGSGPKDGIHVAFSPDGIHWKPHAKNPVLSVYSDTGQVVLYDPAIQRYVAFGRFGFGRKVARTESKDFVTWTEPELVLEPDERDGPKTQFYGISVNLYEGVYIGVLWMFRIETRNIGQIDFQLCHSRDGKTWTRDPERTVFLPLGPTGAWDGGDMRGACRSVILPDEVRFYYAGSAADHGKGGETKIGMDIGLATLRRDGWVSLDAGKKRGNLVTRKFVYPGGRLHVNYQGDWGKAEYSIYEGNSKPDNVTEGSISGDLLNGTFSARRLSPELTGKTVRLRLTMRDAKLYSLWFE
jgi:hypothetical protein